MYIHSKILFKLIQKFPFLSKIVTITDGYIPDELNEKDYIVGQGAVDKIILKEDGQWTDYVPSEEVQRGKKMDTMGCTGYGLLNVLETLSRFLWDKEWNKSDRFTNKMSGTTKRGNSMRTVLDSVRKYHGVVNEETWPWDRETFGWSEYYASVPKKIIEVGKEFTENYDLKYEWLYPTKQLMKASLKYSPLYVAGYAWYRKGDGKYYSYGKANHAFTIVGYKDGEYWLAFDSYPPYIKKLDWNYDFSIAYVVTLRKKSDFNVSKLNELADKGYQYIIRPLSHGEMYKIENNELIPISKEEARDVGLNKLREENKLIGIDEEFYKKLIL